MGELSFKTVSMVLTAQQPPNAQQAYMEKGKRVLLQYADKLTEAWCDPMLIDDSMRDMDFGIYLLTQCETLICLDGDKVVGFAIFANPLPGRHAEFMGWVDPEYRKGNYKNQKVLREFARAAINYAWEVLRAVRLHCRIVAHNQPALRFVRNAGFKNLTKLTLDFQTGGQLFDSFLLEQVNPAYVLPEIEETKVKESHGIKRKGRQQQLQAEPISDELTDRVAELPGEGSVLGAGKHTKAKRSRGSNRNTGS